MPVRERLSDYAISTMQYVVSGNTTYFRRQNMRACGTLISCLLGFAFSKEMFIQYRTGMPPYIPNSLQGKNH